MESRLRINKVTEECTVKCMNASVIGASTVVINHDIITTISNGEYVFLYCATYYNALCTSTSV